MSAVLQIKPPEFSVQDIAKQCLEAVGNDVGKATKLMEEEILKHEAKYHALMDPLLGSACYAAISQCISKTRCHIWTAPNYTAAGNGERVHALASGNLLMFPLPGGQYLGEATKPDVLAAATFYSKQANDMAHKARWLDRIASSLSGKKTVNKVFTEEALRQLQAEVANA